MANSVDEVWRLLAVKGFLLRREHPELLHTLQWLLRSGQLHALYPGVYVHPASKGNLDLRIRAAAAWHPDAVVLGDAAIRLTWDPQHRVREIVLASPAKRVAPQGVRLVRWRVPAEHVRRVHGVQVSSAALTALEVVPTAGGAPIDEVLRRGLATLEHLWRALRATAGRRRNPYRRMMLHDSRDEPWSEAEREVHRLLRKAGITGWRANEHVLLSDGMRVLPDVTFKRERVCLEVDGYEFHRVEQRKQFEYDRWKGTQLAADHWTVLRFTYRQLVEQSEWVVSSIRRALGRPALV